MGNEDYYNYNLWVHGRGHNLCIGFHEIAC